MRVAWPEAQGASRANRRRRPIKLERARSFHLQIQACVCSGSAEDVSSLCRAKRLQVFIFQLDKDCDLSWREKGQTVSQHELCPAGQSRPSVGRVLGNVLFPVTQKSVWLRAVARREDRNDRFISGPSHTIFPPRKQEPIS